MATLQEQLVRVNRLYIDTAPFIYFTEGWPSRYQKMAIVFAAMDAGTFEGITSAVAITEVLVKPIEVEDRPLIQKYRQMLQRSRNLSVIAVSPLIAEQAAHLRTRYRIRTPDVLHLATALTMNCDAFLTNDRQLTRIEEIPIWLLDTMVLPVSE